MPKEIRPDRVAIYIRWSTDDQSEGTTLAVQREACRNYILSQGWQVRDDLVFIDDGYSGGTLKRPALTRLRESVRQGRIDCVVVFKLDRLSRSVIDVVNLALREWDDFTCMKSAREPLDTTTAMGKQFFYMLAGYAEWERNVIRERMHAGKLRRLQEGKNPGYKRPYGYAIGPVKGSFVPVFDEASVVRRIFEMYVAGHGYKSIAATLSADGIAFRGGRTFSSRTVYGILTNRTYIGEIVYRKTVANPRRHAQEGVPRQLRNPSPIVVKSSVVPPIVSGERFEQAQALRAHRAEERAPNRALTSDHLLTGLARCARCGYALIGRRREPAGERRHTTGNRQYYFCGGKRLKGCAFCDCAYIRQDVLDALIVQRLQERYAGELGRHHYVEAIEAEVSRSITHVQENLRRLQAEAVASDKELAVIARDYRREQLTLQEYREQKAQVQTERAVLQERVRTAESRLQGLKRQWAARRAMVSLLDHVPLWDGLTQAQKKHLLREFIADLRVYAGPHGCDPHCEVTWAGRE